MLSSASVNHISHAYARATIPDICCRLGATMWTGNNACKCICGVSILAVLKKALAAPHGLVTSRRSLRVACTFARGRSLQPAGPPSGAPGGHPLPLRTLRLMCLRLRPLTPPPPSPQPQALGQSSSRWGQPSLPGRPLLGPPQGASQAGACGVSGWGLGVFCGR